MELHYYATEAAVAALWSRELKIAAPCDFNDPFEFLPATKEVSSQSRLWCLGFQGGSKGNFYALSLSARKNNARMWAQYGGNHTGLMLTLDFEKGLLADLNKAKALRRVDYDQPKRIVLDPRDFSGSEVMELFFRKGKDWEHEAEWRLVLAANMFEKIKCRYGMLNGHVAAFMPLADECIRAVTLGHRSSKELAASILKIKEIRGAPWKVLKAKLSDYEFTFVEEAAP